MRDQLAAMTPRLRRYARALVSGDARASDVADSLVHATLMRAIGVRSLGGTADLPIRLFATVTQLHRDLAPSDSLELMAASRRSAAVAARGVAVSDANPLSSALLGLPVEEREALLLVALERFDHAAAARILRISRPVLLERLTRARTHLGRLTSVPAASEVTRTATRAGAARVPYLRLVVG